MSLVRYGKLSSILQDTFLGVVMQAVDSNNLSTLARLVAEHGMALDKEERDQPGLMHDLDLLALETKEILHSAQSSFLDGTDPGAKVDWAMYEVACALQSICSSKRRGILPLCLDSWVRSTALDRWPFPGYVMIHQVLVDVLESTLRPNEQSAVFDVIAHLLPALDGERDALLILTLWLCMDSSTACQHDSARAVVNACGRMSTREDPKGRFFMEAMISDWSTRGPFQFIDMCVTRQAWMTSEDQMEPLLSHLHRCDGPTRLLALLNRAT